MTKSKTRLVVQASETVLRSNFISNPAVGGLDVILCNRSSLIFAVVLFSVSRR